MKKYDELWCKINNLLSILHQDDVVGMFLEKYQPYNNDAPAKVVNHFINDLQKELDEAEE